MALAVYPGSFDPITLGHCDIIRRMQPILGEIVVLIARSSKKVSLFTAEERKALAEEALKDLPGVKVDIHEGLTVDYCKAHGAKVIIRGLRAVADYEYELAMSNMNKKLWPEVETMIVFSSPGLYFVSSNIVKEVASLGGEIHGLVPIQVEEALRKKFAKK